MSELEFLRQAIEHLELFAAGLVMDYHVIEHALWRNAYLAAALGAFAVVAGLFFSAFRRTQ